MTRLSDINSYGEELEKRLRLQTFPFAVKMIEKEEDVPEGAIRPKRDLGGHLALCQAFAMSRRQGATVAMLKEDMWCYPPVMALGFAEVPAYYLEGNMYYPSAVMTSEAAKNLTCKFPCLEFGKYAGIVSAPLRTADFEPDVVVIYCNSVQLMQLLFGIRYKEGKLVTSSLSPGAACVNATVPVMQGGNCEVTVPCPGDRRWAMAQDDEMVFSVPAGQLEDLMLGLRYRDEAGQGLPVQFAIWPDYSLSESYVKMSKMLGMEVPE